MDRFLDSASPAKKLRSKAVQADLNACRERIQVLTQGSVSLGFHVQSSSLQTE
jgi:hypothetical protein